MDKKTNSDLADSSKFFDPTGFNNATDCDSQGSHLSFTGGDVENYYKSNKKRMQKLDDKKSPEEKSEKKSKKSSKKKSVSKKSPEPVLITIKQSPIIQEIMR